MQTPALRDILVTSRPEMPSLLDLPVQQEERPAFFQTTSWLQFVAVRGVVERATRRCRKLHGLRKRIVGYHGSLSTRDKGMQKEEGKNSLFHGGEMFPARALAQGWLWMFQGQRKSRCIAFCICYRPVLLEGWRVAFLTQMSLQIGPTSAPSSVITHIPAASYYSSAEYSLRNLSLLISPHPICVSRPPNSWPFCVTRVQELTEANKDLFLKASIAELISSNFKDLEGRNVHFFPRALKKT